MHHGKRDHRLLDNIPCILGKVAHSVCRMKEIRSSIKTTGSGSAKCWHDGKSLLLKRTVISRRQARVQYYKEQWKILYSLVYGAFRRKVLDVWMFKQYLQSHHSGNFNLHKTCCWFQHAIESEVLKRSVNFVQTMSSYLNQGCD